MYMHIPGLLSPDNLKEIDALVSEAPFVEGNRTAGPLTKSIKNNLQLDREKFTKAQELDNAFLNALWKNLHIRASGLPKRITPPENVRSIASRIRSANAPADPGAKV